MPFETLVKGLSEAFGALRRGRPAAAPESCVIIGGKDHWPLCNSGFQHRRPAQFELWHLPASREGTGERVLCPAGRHGTGSMKSDDNRNLLLAITLSVIVMVGGTTSSACRSWNSSASSRRRARAPPDSPAPPFCSLRLLAAPRLRLPRLQARRSPLVRSCRANRRWRSPAREDRIADALGLDRAGRRPDR